MHGQAVFERREAAASVAPTSSSLANSTSATAGSASHSRNTATANPSRWSCRSSLALEEIIAAIRPGDLTFLVTEHGQSFTANDFGNKMRQWCDEAGLPECTAHGLRKTGAGNGVRRTNL